MKIPVTLNNKRIVLNTDPSESLLNILRREKLFSVKCGCEKGVCGNCMILLNDKCVASCIIPAGIVRDCKIVTLEFFKTYPEYQDIITGFSQAGVHLCGYCSAGKFFTAYSILQKKERPNIQEIYSSIKGLDCCCTDKDTLTNGILYSIAANHTRTRQGKKDGKK